MLRTLTRHFTILIIAIFILVLNFPMDDTTSDQEAGVEFDPDRCAALHNELLTKAVSHIPDAAQNFRQDCIQQALQYAPGWADTKALQKEDIVRFFSQLNVHDPVHGQFTGELRQPDGSAFWNPTYGEFIDPDIILLYPTALDIQNDAGLYLDLFTKRVTWGNIECGRLPPSDSESWVPLEMALKKLLEMWDRGKYYWSDEVRGSILVRAYTPEDVDETLFAWSNLLETIQAQLAQPNQITYRDPLPPKRVDQFQISPFAKAFLTRAQRPPFTFVAPGITTFTDERFEAVMTSELPDSKRHEFMKRFENEPDFFPSLILPLVDESSRLKPPFGPAQQYLERFTISLLPGLYIAVDDKFADTMRLVTAQGTDKDMVFKVQRPWGVERELRFAELFNIWAYYVDSGIWEVGADGVSTPQGWFSDPETKKNREFYFTEATI